MGFFKLLTRFGGRDMAVDLGEANTLGTCAAGGGSLLSSCELVAVRLALGGGPRGPGSGGDAECRPEAGTIQAIRAVKDGVIRTEFEVTEEEMRHFIRRSTRNRWAIPGSWCALPSGVNGVEKSAVVEEACLRPELVGVSDEEQGRLRSAPGVPVVGAHGPMGRGHRRRNPASGGRPISLGGIVVSQFDQRGRGRTRRGDHGITSNGVQVLIGQQTRREV